MIFIRQLILSARSESKTKKRTDRLYKPLSLFEVKQNDKLLAAYKHT
jgi:hypothetical protein